MTKLVCSVAALMLARGRLSNQDRIDNPLSVDDATRLVLESGDKLQVFFGLNRLMNIAVPLWREDKRAACQLWTDIGTHLQTVNACDPSLLGYNTLRRYARATSDKGLARWAWQEARKRDPDQPMKAEPIVTHAGADIVELVQPAAKSKKAPVAKTRAKKAA